MNTIALLASVLDAKWALPPDADYLASPDSLAAIPRKLSPFDEAALEVALKLRDADPATRISVYMPDGPGAEGLMRGVAAHKPDIAARLAVPEALRWDAYALANSIRAQLAPIVEGPALWLVGREFGDLDDGVFASALARALGIGLIAMTEGIQADDQGALRAQRTRGETVERIALPDQCVVSITNDAGNKLRHPLMKNVMLAKKLNVTCLAAPVSQPPARIVPIALAGNAREHSSKGAPIPTAAGIAAQVEAVFQFLSASYPT
ncbi:hypothetical protein [Cupriavidus sp. CuC1]|uniref:hypothetical protein n=1 Tax=Cupriavidus sp. CuC1 TaxID=3373131 RepID=UPI0037D1A5CC